MYANYEEYEYDCLHAGSVSSERAQCNGLGSNIVIVIVQSASSHLYFSPSVALRGAYEWGRDLVTSP